MFRLFTKWQIKHGSTPESHYSVDFSIRSEIAMSRIMYDVQVDDDFSREKILMVKNLHDMIVSTFSLNLQCTAL